MTDSRRGNEEEEAWGKGKQKRGKEHDERIRYVHYFWLGYP